MSPPNPSRSPDHRVPIGDGWSLWRWFKLRSAGFPARLVLDLASPDAAAASDRLSAAEDAVAVARELALAALDAMLDGRKGRERRPIIRAIKLLRRGEVPDPSAELAPAADALASLTGPVAAAAGALAEAERALDRAQDHELAVLARVAREPRFREAIAWQNRGSLRTALDLLGPGAGADVTSKQRQHRRLVASYLQRYCAKNDAAGFFGPGVWGRLDPSGAAIEVRPGPGLLAARRLYFEYWGIDALAQVLARDPELRPHLAPRRVPTIWLEGTALHYPVDRAIELPAEYTELVRACDGERTAREIAGQVVADPDLDIDDPDEVYALLEELEQRELITWTLELPTALAHPERHLRGLLERAGQAGGRGLAALDELERARGDVARAAGDADALDRALGAMEETFERLTEARATRAAGQMYAGRTLVFENCQRDIDLTAGSDYLGRVGPLLVLLLSGARWYTHIISVRYRAALDEAFGRLVDETGRDEVDFLRFWERVAIHFPGQDEPAPIVRGAREELQRRWAGIVGLAGAVQAEGAGRAGRARAIDLGLDDIEEAVRREFAAPGPGWPSARFHSADVMIAARGPDAARRGEYTLCLGELHVGVDNTANPGDRDQHVDPGALIRAREVDIPGSAVVAVRAKDQAKFGGQLLMSRHDLDLELGLARSWRARASVLAVGALSVARVDGRVVVRDRAGGRSFDAVSFMQDYILAEEEAAGGLAMFPPLAHMPRVTLGGVVVAREQWRLLPEALPFARAERSATAYAAARRWARELGLPRWVFVKTPEEVKPVFIDLDSPLYVELLAKLARGASRITVSEMLPTFDETWLPDADANLYTSELRLLALDPVAGPAE